MITNIERFKIDLGKLTNLGDEMKLDLYIRGQGDIELKEEERKELEKKIKGSFEEKYQKWYTEACAVIKQLIPDRLQEFTHLYHGDGRRKQIDVTSYNIQDWLNGIKLIEDVYGKKRFNDLVVVFRRLDTQLKILKSAQSRFESSLFNMAQLLRADLFDSELDADRELTRNGFNRGAGAVAGVVIEKHLSQVCINHSITTRKQHMTINNLNDLLKDAKVIEVLTWRNIQRLADIRNLCDHDKKREPTKDEVSELIEGADKLCKTLF